MVNYRLFAVAVLAALTSTACVVNLDGQGVVVREEKRFDVTGDLDLTLGTFDGSIRVRAWDRNEVLVEIERRGQSQEEAEALEVQTTQEGNRIRVDARSPRVEREGFHLGNFASPSVSLIVSVPQKLALRAETGDGSIAVERLSGRIQLKTGDGSIRAESIAGDLTVNTGDGSVSLTGGSGRAVLDTGDGSIAARGRYDSLQVSTGDGSVSVEAEQGSVMTEDWNLTTGDGSIAFNIPTGFNAEIDAESGDGSVRAEGSSLATTRGEGDQESIRGRLGTGGRMVRLRSGDGSIRVISR